MYIIKYKTYHIIRHGVQNRVKSLLPKKTRCSHNRKPAHQRKAQTHQRNHSKEQEKTKQQWMVGGNQIGDCKYCLALLQKCTPPVTQWQSRLSTDCGGKAFRLAMGAVCSLSCFSLKTAKYAAPRAFLYLTLPRSRNRYLQRQEFRKCEITEIWDQVATPNRAHSSEKQTFLCSSIYHIQRNSSLIIPSSLQVISINRIPNRKPSREKADSNTHKKKTETYFGLSRPHPLPNALWKAQESRSKSAARADSSVDITRRALVETQA